jgi:iron complex transport system substrate-binding protein
VVSTSVFDPATMSSAEIDRAVAEASRKGESLYRVDATRIESLKPDVLLTQTLCAVCAVTPYDVSQVVERLGAKVVALHAHDLGGMFRDLRLTAEAVGKDPRPLERALRGRLAAVRRAVKGAPRRRVFCLEWADPLYAAGHWVPEMVAWAGGRDALARPKQASRRIEWRELAAWAPEVVLAMPCGFSMERGAEELRKLAGRPEWEGLPAVRSGEVWVVDGPAYFNGAGPRLVDGVELVAGILHPDRVRRPRKGARRLRNRAGNA